MILVPRGRWVALAAGAALPLSFAPFGFWWLANVPLTIYAHGYINMRDSARKRMIVSDQLERQYWLSMLEEEDDVD